MLEFLQIRRAQGISFGYDRDKIDTGAETLHNLNVQRFERVASRSNEVKAGVYSQINFIMPFGLLLLKHVRLVLIIQEFNDWHPGIAVVHIVAKARGIDNGQADYSTQQLQKSVQNIIGPLKNFSSSSALVISISTVLSICFACLRL